MPGSPGDPVQLDPFQNIVNVGWPTRGGMLAVQFYLRGTGGRPLGAITLSGLPWNTTTIYTLTDAGAVQFLDSQGRVVFNKPALDFVVPGNSEVAPRVRSWFFIDLNLVRQYLPADDKNTLRFHINTPAGGTEEQEPFVTYWIWATDMFPSFQANFDNPFTTGDIFAGGALMVVPRPFSTAAEAQVYVDAYISPAFAIHIESGSNTVTVNREWEINVATYRTRTTFPRDSQGNADWDEGEAVDGDGRSETVNPFPARRIDYEITISTLDVSAVQS